MLQRTKFFIVVWLLTSSVTIFGQENPQNVGKKLIGNKEILKSTLYRIRQDDIESNQVNISKNVFKKEHYTKVKLLVDYNFAGPVYQIIYAPNPVSYLKDLGWMCIKEAQFEKATHIPLRLRLGSLNYVDWMEHTRSPSRCF